MTSTITYNKPPLVETVLGVQFSPPENFQLTTFGLFWSKYLRDRFPEVTQQPPYILQIEEEKLAVQGLQFRFTQELPPSRAWFLAPETESGQELIQLQPTLLMHNWRKKLASVENYPRYQTNANRFERLLTEFRQFLEEEQIGSFRANQCELTYVNHIPIDPDCLNPGKMFARVFTAFDKSSAFCDDEPRDALMLTSSRWFDKLAGRLHLTAVLARLNLTDEAVIDFKLVCRGTPPGSSNKELMSWFDVAHILIVETFDKLTQPEMHTRWGKK